MVIKRSLKKSKKFQKKSKFGTGIEMIGTPVSLTDHRIESHPNNYTSILFQVKPNVNNWDFVLTNVDAFRNLKIIDCSNSAIRYIDNLPNTIEHLISNGCRYLESIELSNELETLQCSNCPNLQQISTISNKASNKLEILSCADCVELTTLPSILPFLEKLVCSNSILSELPLLPKLEYLDCSYCPYIEKLIPDNRGLVNGSSLSFLKYLDCRECSELKYLPEKLSHLKLLICLLTSITKISHTYISLEKLDCSFCDAIPKLPYFSNLKKINVSFCSKSLKESPQPKTCKVIDFEKDLLKFDHSIVNDGSIDEDAFIEKYDELIQYSF